MLSNILIKVCAFFTSNKVGIILKILFAKASSSIVSELLNKENQQKAYEFVKELNSRNDLTVKEKAEMFNKKMHDWLRDFTKKELSDSMINCLREFALSALKAESSEE